MLLTLWPPELPVPGPANQSVNDDIGGSWGGGQGPRSCLRSLSLDFLSCHLLRCVFSGFIHPPTHSFVHLFLLSASRWVFALKTSALYCPAWASDYTQLLNFWVFWIFNTSQLLTLVLNLCFIANIRFVFGSALMSLWLSAMWARIAFSRLCNSAPSQPLLGAQAAGPQLLSTPFWLNLEFKLNYPVTPLYWSRCLH